VKKSAGRAFVYYLIFTTVYSIVVCGIAMWWAWRQWTPAVEFAKRSIPPFEVRLSEGHLSTTLPEPLVFSDQGFAFIIDTSGKELDASPYESAILLGQTRGIFKKDRFESREYSWSAVPDFQVTANDVLDWLTAYKGTILWSVFVTVAMGVLPIAWLMFIPVILFLALLLMIPAKILGAPLRYGQAASIAFYAVTLPTIAQTALLAGGLATNGTFWGIYLLWAVVGVAVCRGLDQAPTPASPSGVPPPPPATVS
jgi:uncharacterized protein DUF1189